MQLETYALAVAVATAVTYFFMRERYLEDSILLGFLSSAMWFGLALTSFDIQRTIVAFNESGGVFETTTVNVSDPAISWAFIFIAVIVGTLTLIKFATLIKGVSDR